MERIMAVVGTRPEAIKLCPLIREMKKRNKWSVEVCSTGQHRAMLDNALEAFEIKPDFDLDVMRTGQTLSGVTARILKGMDEILAAQMPDAVIVQGDTTTAFTAALAAFHRRIPIAHVEAGLRTYHMDAPFPEEMHRRAIALLANFHFAPTVSAKKTAAHIPPADAVKPPVNTPRNPCSSTAFRTPFASVFPNPVSGTDAPAPANSHKG